MLDSRTLVALVALLGAPLAAADNIAPSCTPAADHSNYSGDHGLDANQAWCPWDAAHGWKPLGIGCKNDTECQKGGSEGNKCIFQYTNGHDMTGINLDILLDVGIGFCGNALGGGSGTECMCGAPPLLPHPGGSNNYPNPGPGQTPAAMCRELLSKWGFPGGGIAGGCHIPHGDNDAYIQCMFTCNGDSTTCSPGDDPKAIRKLFLDLPDCPGFTSVPFTD